MPLLDALRKKDKINAVAEREPARPIPEFTFLRTTTNTQEILEPPSHPYDSDPLRPPPAPRDRSRTRLSPFRRNSRNVSPQPQAPQPVESKGSPESKKTHRLSTALHLNRGRGTSQSSPHVPEDLPNIAINESNKLGDKDEVEAKWEKRATLLAAGARSRSVSASGDHRTPAGTDATVPITSPSHDRAQRPTHTRHISDAEGDVTIQEAVRLHEAGDLERSTEMFGKLAEPSGENNALAQVLYGLALRHGWGIEANPSRALTYLSAAAENAAEIESIALNEGKRKGGAAKGELTLAIYELANSFRHGWGVSKDPVAARQYYETAANLGDFDAMAEVANCYLEGIGGKKDKWKAAQYLRRAEKEGGRKEVGGSWIWKEKYNEDQDPEQLRREKGKK